MNIKTFSLLSVSSKNDDGTVNGYWIQDCVGTFDEAVERARRASELNSGIHVAVVDGLSDPIPQLGYHNYKTISVQE